MGVPADRMAIRIGHCSVLEKGRFFALLEISWLVARLAGRRNHAPRIAGREPSLSNLDKVLYPAGFTKGQVIDTTPESHAISCRTPKIGRSR